MSPTRKFIIGKRRIRQLAKRDVELTFLNINDTSLQCSSSTNPSEGSTNTLVHQEVSQNKQCIPDSFTQTAGFLENDNFVLIESTCRSFQSSEEDTSLSENSDVEIEVNLCQELQKWYIEHSVNHKQFSELLKILKKHSCFKNLPSDSRSIVKIPPQPVSVDLAPGKYVHFGLEKQIKKIKPESTPLRLQLQINVDGLPIFKSNSINFWPILGYFVGISDQPFVIGIFCGKQKPTDPNSFLRPFVDDFKQTCQKLNVIGSDFQLEIHSFVCDAPAKAYIKCIKGHMGYYGCDKCEVEGKYVNRRVCFKNIDSKHRNNESFRNKSNEEHHTGTSVLESIPNLDMVGQFPCEYMHLICLGVVKKLIGNWVDGKPSDNKLSAYQIGQISQDLLARSTEVVSEFSRKPRALNELPRWKATELRLFLLYVGPVVLKRVINNDNFKVFMSLHVATSILVNPERYKTLNSYAHDLLRYVVSSWKILFGEDNVSYNVHCLTHIAKDALKLGALDTFGAFKFESKLGQLKKLIRTPHKPLEQVVRRILESECFEKHVNGKNEVKLRMEHTRDNLPPGKFISQHHILETKQYTLRCKNLKDSYFLTHQKQLVSVKNIYKSDQSNDNISILGEVYSVKSSFFTDPCDSKFLNILLFHKTPSDNNLKLFAQSDIAFKCQVFSLDNALLAFPLLHLI